jgi:two-component system, LytTR family, response regulator
MSKRIRVLIVDDEPLARERITGMLKGDSDIEIIGTCANGRDAVSAIQKQSPDLVFLDIQMPEMDGFEVLQKIPPESMPLVIFVTAYDKYALRAFEVFALDYLLKPFDRERFQKALTRVKSEVFHRSESDFQQQVLALLEDLKIRPQSLTRMAVKSGGRIFFLRADEIDWVEAEGNYVRLHVGKESYLLRETIGALEEQLDRRKFLRIHRSTIVNIDRIQELQPWFHGEFRVILRNGTALMLSRTHREKLQELLGKPI